MYCRGCDIAICVMCSTLSHMQHDVCPLSDEAITIKSRLTKATQELEEIARKTQAANAEVASVSEALFGIHPLAGVEGIKRQGQTTTQTAGGLQGNAIRNIQLHSQTLREQASADIRRLEEEVHEDLRQKEKSLIAELQRICAEEGGLMENQMDELSSVVGRSYSLAFLVKQRLTEGT